MVVSNQADLLAWILLHHAEEYPLPDLAERLGVPVNTLHREVQLLVPQGVHGSIPARSPTLARG